MWRGFATASTEMSSGYIKYKTAQIAIIGHTGDRRDVLIDGGGTNRGLYSDTYSVSNRLESVTVTNCYYTHSDTSTTWGDGGAGLGTWTSYMVVSNCTFVDCHQGGSYKYSYGGALYCQANYMRIEDCSFINNSSINRGGAVYVEDNRIGFSCSNCHFAGNWAELSPAGVDVMGGALAGLINNTSNKSVVRGMVLSACDFTDNFVTNSSGNSSGGAVCGRLAHAVGCTFTGNRTYSSTTAGNGGAWAYVGGVSVAYDALGFTNVLINCDFIGNAAQGDGGAVFNTKVNNSIFSNCTLRANSSKSGSGAACFATSYNRVVDCRFLCNSNLNYATTYCGIVYGSGCSRYTRCIFEGNVSHGWDSALYLTGASADAPSIIDRSVFRANLQEYDPAHTVTPYNANYAQYYGPVYLGGAYIEARNCLFAANTNYLSNVSAISMPAVNGNLTTFTGRKVDNCTFVGNRAGIQKMTAWGGATVHAMPIFTSSAEGTTACRNLIFSDNCNVTNADFIVDMGGTNSDKAMTNCLFETAWTMGTTPAEGYNGCKVGKSARFKNAATGDYGLKAGSPARNAGVNLDWMVGTTDLAGKDRINTDDGAIADLGCYEYYPWCGLMILFR